MRYANIASVLWAESGDDAVREFVRRLVFSVLIGNADMHLKNWPSLYPDRRAAVLLTGLRFCRNAPAPSERHTCTFQSGT